MKIIAECSEDEMILEFLKSMLESSRFSDTLISYCKLKNISLSVITDPDIGSEKENKLRKRVLHKCTGYGDDAGMFKGWPYDSGIQWYWVQDNRDDFNDLRYLNFSEWQWLTHDSRRIEDGIKLLPKCKGKEKLWKAVEAIKKRYEYGDDIPAPIYIIDEKSTHPVILEGNARMTALKEASAPDNWRAILGKAPSFQDWKYY